jgi:hypothetical protein
MNKKGVSGILLIVLVILGVVVATQFMNKQPASGGTGGTGTTIVTAGTSPQITGVDALSEGTSVGTIRYWSLSGGNFATITEANGLSPNQAVKVLFVNNTGYHNVYLEGLTVPSSPTFPIAVKLYKNSSASITMFNTNGVVTTTTGTVNQTVAVGGSYNLKMRFDGQDKTSTNPMRCIVETSVGANVSNIVMSGFGAVISPKGVNSKPNWYTLAGTGSSVYVYDIQPVIGATSPEGTISISAATAKAISGSRMLITCNTKETFLDTTTGVITHDVEDSVGTVKSIAAYTSSLYFT